MGKIESVIVEQIIEAKPNLPNKETILQLTFKWNKEGLSTWDGGEDLNADIRERVIRLLEKYFNENDTDFRAILIFLLKQEIKDCYEGEYLSNRLRICYDNLAKLKYFEDIPLLLAANDETSFDANCGLFKDRLFYNGYEETMKYLKSNKEIDNSVVESMQQYAAYFGYDKE